MRSLFQKSLISSGILIVSLALAGNAMAANSHVKARTTAVQSSYRPTVDVAAIPPYPNYSSSPSSVSPSRGGFDVAANPPYSYPTASFGGPGINVGQLIGAVLGGLPPQYAAIVQNAMTHRGSHGSSGTYDSTWDSPTYDTSSPTDTSVQDSLNEQSEAQSLQEMNDTNAMTASMAAAEQQNDAANAAALQTEINAGM
jgi:hypothetical protein